MFLNKISNSLRIGMIKMMSFGFGGFFDFDDFYRPSHFTISLR